MRFVVYQVSRKGGREKNEDRMGYCYTRESGLFALADGMGGHPEGEVASQLALQTLAARFQREAKPALTEPLRFLHEAIVAGHHQLLRYATERALIDTPRTTIVACVLQGNAAYWAHCGDSRLYLVRGNKLDRAHARPFLHRAAADHGAGGADRRAREPQRALHLPGQPGQAGGRHRRAAAPASGRPADAVQRRPVGRAQRRRHLRADGAPAAVGRRARAGRDGAAQRRAEERQRHRAVRRVGIGRRRRRAERRVHAGPRRAGLRLHHPGQPAGRRAARRARRRRDRTLDPRDQRSHPALCRSARLDPPEAPAALPPGGAASGPAKPVPRRPLDGPLRASQFVPRT